MHVYAIFANDKLNGISHTLFQNAIETLQAQGHTVDTLYLYDHEKEVPFFRHDREYMESHPFYQRNKERFLKADALLLAFPLFWYSVPGLLKAWLDLINGWAYHYESGTYAQARHSIKKALIIYTCMQKREHLNEALHAPVEQQLDETCKFIGINDVTFCMLDQVTNMNEQKLIDSINILKNWCMSC